jgi:hypothetical protein
MTFSSYALTTDTHTRSKALEETERSAYETPEVVDTFEASEVMGTAEGQTCGNGSQVSVLG